MENKSEVTIKTVGLFIDLFLLFWGQSHHVAQARLRIYNLPASLLEI